MIFFRIAQRQIYYLIKYWNFAKAAGNYDQDQEKLREKALKYWELPDFIERPVDLGRNMQQNHPDYHSLRQQQQREPPASTLQRFAGNVLLF